MTNGTEDSKRQSKRAEIDSLLQKVANYVNEGRTMAEQVNLTLLQERLPEHKSDMGKGVLSPTNEKCGWFDTVINRLVSINHNIEKINAHLANVHREVVTNKKI